MRLNGRALAAAALAVCVACGGSLPPPATQPAASGPSAPGQPAATGVGVQGPPVAATASLAGVIVSAGDRRPQGRARVMLTGSALGAPRVAITGSEGRYEFRSLAPGEYGVAVSRTGYAPRQFGEHRAAAPAVVPLAAGQTITGDVGPDGTYRIRGLMAGAHVIALEGLQPPWILKSVTYRGQDITDLAFDVEAGEELRDVRVTITDAATDLSGMVRDGGGREMAGAIVLLIPSSPQFWTRMSRRFGLLRTDAGGRYRIRGLPAGEYRALATIDIDESEATRRDLLQALVARAVPVSLKDRERRALDLTLVSLAAARRTAAR